MDAERASLFTIARLEAGERVPPFDVERLQRGDYSLFAGHRSTGAFDNSPSLAGMEARLDQLCRLQLPRWSAAPVYSPIFARLGRLSRSKGKPASVHRLLRQLNQSYPSASSLLCGPVKRISRLLSKHLGHHRERQLEGIRSVGRASARSGHRRNGGAFELSLA